jgi:hypothetical protein
VRQLTKAGCKKVLRETARGAKTNCSQLRKALDQLDADDVLATPIHNSGWRAVADKRPYGADEAGRINSGCFSGLVVKGRLC